MRYGVVVALIISEVEELTPIPCTLTINSIVILSSKILGESC
jgi:hypothetical protein